MRRLSSSTRITGTRLIVVPLLLAATVATSSHAGRAPLITDPKGDHAVGDGDIVMADMRTVRTGRGVLRIDLQLATPPTTAPYAYAVNFRVGSCRFAAIYYPRPLDTSAVGCRDADGSTARVPPGHVEVNGATITWLVPLAGPLKRGAVARDIEARTAPSGLASGGLLNELGDVGVAFTAYRIGD